MKERNEAKKWAQEKAPDELKCALQAVSKAAYRSETQTKIPLKTNGEAKEVLLADLVIGKLKKMGFGVYCRESSEELKEYCVVWGKDATVEPEGFVAVG